ncbi:toll/interleukin-1 receptor domain-containing protein [Catelliglobosispora koreensis]|uniref:toll/interleukin-1 receptor domain-containing protein n=1 Tax=Catelliglobosispora koreensis TaxID=129052 RepID=UPI00037C78C9|nr:toll/interleukin-1 receptor domain-containing protein [Catelliglobosispora koreensis]
MQHVFISYSRKERPWVIRLKTELEARHVPVWIDEDDIPPTIEWKVKILEEIEAATAVFACRSVAFDASDECQSEVKHARQFGTRVLECYVGEDPAAAADRLLEVLVVEGNEGQLTLDDVHRAGRIELRRAARDWQQSGRRRRGLASRARRRVMVRGLRLPPQAEPYELDYLRDSRSRTRRRAAMAMAAVVLVIGGFGLSSWYAARNVAVGYANEVQAATYLEERARQDEISKSIYQGLFLAAKLGDDESAANASVITRALAHRVPDDAFKVDSSAGDIRFAKRPIATDIVVTDSAGKSWTRPTTQDVRAATAIGSVAVEHQQPWPAELTLGPLSQTGTVLVNRSGQLWRTVHFTVPPVAIQLSPDGRLLAAAAGSGVQVADLSTGVVRFGLRGAPGALVDVAWSTDSSRVWALGTRWAVTWRLSDATTLRNDPAESYTALLPSADPRMWWVVGQSGLKKLDTTDGNVTATRTVPDALRLGGGASDGSVAAVTGERLWVVPLVEDGPAKPVDAPGCRFGRPVFVNPATFYLPCLDGDLLTVSVAQAAVTGRLSDIAGLASAAIIPGTEVLLAGNRYGDMFLVAGRSVQRLGGTSCGTGANRIALAPNGKTIVVVGQGSGVGTCGTMWHLTGADPAQAPSWTWQAIAEPEHRSIVGTSAALNLNGDAFATAYSNGTVILHATANLTPAVVVGTAVGAVRDLATTTDGHLLIVTSEGMVQRTPFCDGCVTNAALAKEAAARLERAFALDLATRVGS